jgi:cytochrome c oxidase assembly factor CtaG
MPIPSTIVAATRHPGAVTVLGSWRFDPLVVSGILLTALIYLRAVRRVWRTRSPSAFPRARVISFLAGLAVLYLALQSPLDTYADLLLSAHMGQHLLLTMVAAPLLVLGTPVTLALAATSARTRRRFLLPVLHSRTIRVVSSPLFAFALFALVMWGSHFSPVFEAALGNENIHFLEHLAYLSAALVFWWPVVGLDPNPARLSHPGRVLYVFLAMPVMAILGLAIYSSDRLLYPHYGAASRSIGISPIADQHLAGAIMWEGGMLIMVVALALVLLDWMRRDEREAERVDARLARAPGAPAVGERLEGRAST